MSQADTEVCQDDIDTVVGDDEEMVELNRQMEEADQEADFNDRMRRLEEPRPPLRDVPTEYYPLPSLSPTHRLPFALRHAREHHHRTSPFSPPFSR